MHIVVSTVIYMYQITSAAEIHIQIDFSRVTENDLKNMLPDIPEEHFFDILSGNGPASYLGVKALGQLDIIYNQTEIDLQSILQNPIEHQPFVENILNLPPNIIVSQVSSTQDENVELLLTVTVLPSLLPNHHLLRPLVESTSAAAAVAAQQRTDPAMDGRVSIAHGTNLFAVYTAVRQSNSTLLSKKLRAAQNVEFSMGAQQAINDEFNDDYVSVISIKDSTDDWFVVPFLWGNAVAHVWTVPHQASQFGIKPQDYKYGLSGPAKYAYITKNDVSMATTPGSAQSKRRYRSLYDMESHVPVIALGYCDGELAQKSVGEYNAGKISGEMGCDKMVITDIYVPSPLVSSIQENIGTRINVHPFEHAPLLQI